jgi:membrane protein YqaA with SNARE-associated domain
LSLAALASLALAAFLAATPVPFQSEVVFLGLMAAGEPVWPLVLVASVANTLGSCLTYAIGRGIGRLGQGRLAPTAAQRQKAEAWFARWGIWALLFSWAPGGDLIVLGAGLLRSRFWPFLALVALAKTGRYLALAGVAGLALGA